MGTKKRIIITTSCDRPRCGRVISEREENDPPPEDKEPDFILKRKGKPDIVYPDTCSVCDNAIAGYCDKIEKKPAEKKAEPAAPVEPVDPGALRWDADLGAWVDGEGVGVGTRNYSHVEVNERTIVIPELEGITDLEEARELIEAAATAGTGEPSDR